MSSSDEEVDPAVEKLNRDFQEAISKRDEANGTFTRTLIGADLRKNTTLEQLLDQSREGSIGLLVLSKKVSKFFVRGYEAGLYIVTADMPSRLRLDPTTCMWEGQPEPLTTERMLCSTSTHSSYLAAQLMQATGDLAKRLARRGKGAEGFAQLAGLTVFVMRDGEFILSDNEGMDIPNQGFKALAGAWRELLGKRTAAQLGVTEECLSVVRRYLDRSAKALRELMEEVNTSFDTSDRVVFNPLPRAKKTAKAASAGAGAGAGSGSGSGSGSGAGAGAGSSASASSSRKAKKPALQTAKKSAKQLAQEHADRLVEALNAEFERRNKAGDTFTVAVGGLKPSKCTTLAEALDLTHDGSLGYVTLSKQAGKYFRTGMAAGQWILDCPSPSFAMSLNFETATWEGQPDADEYPEVSFSTTNSSSAMLVADLMVATGDLASQTTPRGLPNRFAQLFGVTNFIFGEGLFVLRHNEGMDEINAGFSALGRAWRTLLGKMEPEDLGVTEDELSRVRHWLGVNATAMRKVLKDVNAEYGTTSRLNFSPLPPKPRTKRALGWVPPGGFESPSSKKRQRK